MCIDYYKYVKNLDFAYDVATNQTSPLNVFTLHCDAGSDTAVLYLDI